MIKKAAECQKPETVSKERPVLSIAPVEAGRTVRSLLHAILFREIGSPSQPKRNLGNLILASETLLILVIFRMVG